MGGQANGTLPVGLEAHRVGVKGCLGHLASAEWTISLEDFLHCHRKNEWKLEHFEPGWVNEWGGPCGP